jgi:hypothetical protein
MRQASKPRNCESRGFFLQLREFEGNIPRGEKSIHTTSEVPLLYQIVSVRFSISIFSSPFSLSSVNSLKFCPPLHLLCLRCLVQPSAESPSLPNAIPNLRQDQLDSNMSFSSLVQDLSIRDGNGPRRQRPAPSVSTADDRTSHISRAMSYASTAATSVSISGDISSQLHGGYHHPLARSWQAERQLTKVRTDIVWRIAWNIN